MGSVASQLPSCPLPFRSPVVKHYKVKREGPKYVIDVEDPFSCPSLEAVVNYFVTQTKRALVPFLLDDDYEKVLGFVDSDQENGESAWAVPSFRGSGPALPANVLKPLPPIPVSVTSQEDKLPQLPPLPQFPDQDENYVTPINDSPAAEYMNQDGKPRLGCRQWSWKKQVAPCDLSLLSMLNDSPAAEYMNQDASLSSQAVPLKPKKLAKLPAKPPKPPVVPKPDLKAITGLWTKKLGGSSSQAPSLVTKLGDITAELEEKLQKRRALEH